MVKKASLYREMLIAFSSEPTVAAILLKLIWIEIELNAVIFEVSSRIRKIIIMFLNALAFKSKL